MCTVTGIESSAHVGALEKLARNTTSAMCRYGRDVNILGNIKNINLLGNW